MAMYGIPYPDIQRILENLQLQIRQIFQDRLIGVYLYGSLVAGDFDYNSSDIDLLVVTSSPMTSSEFEALRVMHWKLASENPAWDDRIDAVYVPEKALREFRTAKSPVVISPGEPFHVREREALLDWLQNWYLVRESGFTLFGPTPAEVIPPITQDEFITAVRKYAMEVNEREYHEMNRKGQAYAILTMCRALYTSQKGKQASKRQAARWAQEQLPEWSGLIQNALTWRQAWREENIDHAVTSPETSRFVHFVASRILA